MADETIDVTIRSKPISVQDVMSSRVRTVPVNATARDAERIANEEGVHHLLVVGDDDDAIGVVCLCDTARAAPEAPVAHCMHSPFVFVCTSWSATEAARLTRQARIGFLPVLDDDGQVRGVVTRRDLREAGLLGNEPGVDRCASCGSSHGLHCSPYTTGGVVFCRSCLDQVSGSIDDIYMTLGGEG